MIINGGTKGKNLVGTPLNVVLNGTILEKVIKYEYLGVIIEENLAWTYHVNKLIVRVQNKIFMFSKIRKYIDRCTAVLLMKIYILPRLEYGDLLLIEAKNMISTNYKNS